MRNNVYIMNYWWNRNNYGAILTAYALQYLIQKYNNNTYLVTDCNCFQKLFNLRYTFSLKFRKKYLNIKNFRQILSDTVDNNITTNTFITGSDQVFRGGTLGSNLRYSQYMLDFVNCKSKKIAFSASFAHDKEQFLKETSSETIEKMRNSLNSFDYISVREKSGLEICSDIFGVNAEWIIDPVFIVNRDFWNKLADNATFRGDNNIVSYVLDTNDDYKKAYKYISDKYNSKIKNIGDSNISVENWLAAIKNCKLFITDSFHGMCFAIIFNKPFICIANKRRGRTRFESILEMLNMQYSCLNNINEIYNEDAIYNSEYEKINYNISLRVNDGINFIEKFLNTDILHSEKQTMARKTCLEQYAKGIKEDNKTGKKYKRIIYNLWLVIFYNLPNTLQNIIRFFKRRSHE